MFREVLETEIFELPGADLNRDKENPNLAERNSGSAAIHSLLRISLWDLAVYGKPSGAAQRGSWGPLVPRVTP
jgi:hypothetical protein